MGVYVTMVVVTGIGSVAPSLARAGDAVVAYHRLEGGRYDQRRRFLDGLKKTGDVVCLTAVAHAASQGSMDAHELAQAAVLLVPSAYVDGYLRQFRVGSAGWSGTVLGIDAHPREAVIEFLKEMGHHPDGQVRWYAYGACLNRGWDDLLDQALADVNSDVIMCFPNCDDPPTLRGAAQAYVAKFGKPAVAPVPIAPAPPTR